MHTAHKTIYFLWINMFNTANVLDCTPKKNFCDTSIPKGWSMWFHYWNGLITELVILLSLSYIYNWAGLIIMLVLLLEWSYY